MAGTRTRWISAGGALDRSDSVPLCVPGAQLVSSGRYDDQAPSKELLRISVSRRLGPRFVDGTALAALVVKILQEARKEKKQERAGKSSG